jgi:hypothetical protein
MQHLEVSGAVRPIYESLGAKGLIILVSFEVLTVMVIFSGQLVSRYQFSW